MSTNLFLLSALALVIGVILGFTSGAGLFILSVIIALPIALTGAVVRAIEGKSK